LQPLYEIVNSEPFKAALVSEVQVLKMVVNLPVVAPAPEINNGTLVRERQPLNMEVICVTAAVLNNGTVVRVVQVLTKFCMFVTEAVLNNGTLVRDVQALNI
jgi:hypothetical protein